MNMMHYEPWLMMNGLNRELARLRRERTPAAHAQPVWTPPVDIREEQDRFCLSMDLPGVDPKSIQVSMEKDVLEISGERKVAEVEQDQPGYHRRERVQGAFKRSFKLPESADASEITAKSEHGVLSVEIKKRAEQQPRRITITH